MRSETGAKEGRPLSRQLAKRVDSLDDRLAELCLATTCGACGASHHDHSESKTWFLNEAARLLAARNPDFLARSVSAQAPGVVRWTRYQGVRGSGPTSMPVGVFEGLWSEFNEWVKDRVCEVDPREKDDSLTISRGVLNERAGKTDVNCSGIDFVFLDCDSVADWSGLASAFAAAGLAATFNQSFSRRGDRWHVRVPLAVPITWDEGDSKAWSIAKLKLRHVAAVMSGWAGFAGVGNRNGQSYACGFDLAVNNLGQAQYLPQRQSSDQAPIDVLCLEGGALDVDTLLEVTGWDEEDALAASGARYVQEAKKRAEFNTRDRRSYGAYSGQLGSLGLALQADGMLGRQKDANALFANCPFNRAHDGDAYYYPSSDTWWCSHDSCKVLFAGGEDRRRKVIDSLGSVGYRVYKAELDKAFTFAKRERKRSSAAIGAWLKDVKGKAREDRLLNSLANVLLGRRYSFDFVVDALAEIESYRSAKERVKRTILRRRANQPTAGAGWVRANLGLASAATLAVAIASDAGEDYVKVASHVMGMGLTRGESAQFLHALHDGLTDGDKLRSYVVRPAACRVYGDKVRQYGKDVGTQTKICESPVCPRCFFVKLLCTNDLIRNGWTINGKRVQGWGARGGDFSVHRVTGIKSLKDLEDAAAYLTRYARGTQRIRFLDMHEGQPALTVITDDLASRGPIFMAMRYWARKHGATYSREESTDVELAIKAATGSFINLHLHQRALLESRDRDGYLEWSQWFYKRHQIARSRRALPWPTREVIAAKTKEANEDEWDIDWDAGGITYTLTHLASGYELGTSEHPHTLYQGIQLAKHRPGLQRIIEPQDPEEMAEIEAMHNERCDRMGIPRIAEGLEFVGAGASAQTWY